VIQLGGTGPADAGWIRQVGWKTNADALSDAALAALSAAKAKNLPALAKANSSLVEACEGCHKAFKPALPTEGIAHQRPHSDSHAGAVVPKTSINALMVTMIDNAGHVLWDAEKKASAPRNAGDWVEIEDHATQLAAAGALIQLGGTGPADAGWIGQVGWKTNADAMTDAALTAVSAAKARNLDALVKANGALVEACEGCHKAFKPALPTEGIAHQHAHADSHRR
jgi:cytochrome c556